MENNKLVMVLIVVFAFVLGFIFADNGNMSMYKKHNCKGGDTMMCDKSSSDCCKHDMSHQMDGMVSSLYGKKGDELDKKFIEDMIVHHQGAIDMANVLLKETKRPELIKLGNDIISAQSSEINMMKNWLGSWFK